MDYLDLTLESPALNLACDEVLLDQAEAGEGGEVLRFWESREPFVVLGYANKVSAEVLSAGEAMPVLRRTTGGGAVVQGPGSLNYAVVLRRVEPGPGGLVPTLNHHVLERNRQALAPLLGDGLAIQGISDLALGDRKISGNAVRLRRRYFLCHGTILLDFEIPRVERVLAMPSRQPEYRGNRPHLRFMTNTGLQREAIKVALRQAWGAREPLGSVPEAEIATLARTRYRDPAWNRRR